MTDLTSAALVDMFQAMADTIEQHKALLCELDGVIGDADHGVTMSIGFTAVQKALSETDTDTATPTDVFNTAAKSFLSAVGASAGPLYATAFMRAGAAVKGKQELDVNDFSQAIQAMAEGIQTRGKAEAGDKTMLDAWLPAAASARQAAASSNLGELMREVSTAANTGADATVPMQAKKGRSAKLGERTIGHKDAGAASTALLLTAIYEHFR